MPSIEQCRHAARSHARGTGGKDCTDLGRGVDVSFRVEECAQHRLEGPVRRHVERRLAVRESADKGAGLRGA